MTIPSWFRFGLPMGSSFVVAAAMDLSTWMCQVFLHVAGVLSFQSKVLDRITAPDKIFTIAFDTTQLLLQFLLWIGFIVKGRIRILFIWICIQMFLFITNIGVFVSFMMKDYQVPSLKWHAFMVWVVRFVQQLYILALASQFLRPVGVFKFAGNDPKPLGKGCKQILTYYNTYPTIGLRVLLIIDLIWSIIILSDEIITRTVLLGEMFDLRNLLELGVMESHVMRFVRVCLSLCGLFLIHQGKSVALYFWMIAEILNFFVSCAIFSAIAFETSEIDVFRHVFLLFFLGDLIFRGFTLIWGVKVVRFCRSMSEREIMGQAA